MLVWNVEGLPAEHQHTPSALIIPADNGMEKFVCVRLNFYFLWIHLFPESSYLENVKEEMLEQKKGRNVFNPFSRWSFSDIWVYLMLCCALWTFFSHQRCLQSAEGSRRCVAALLIPHSIFPPSVQDLIRCLLGTAHEICLRNSITNQRSFFQLACFLCLVIVFS